MQTLLWTCVMLLGADSRQISNGTNLTGNDWSTHESSSQDVLHPKSGRIMGTRTRLSASMLSLREETSWVRGTAWLIKYDETDDRFDATAYKGLYRLAIRDEQDVMVIVLSFIKRYEMSGYISDAQSTKWSLSTSYLPVGGEFVLTLEQGNRIPDDGLELSFERAYYVDEEGDETTRRDSPYTFSERILGTGSVKTLRSPEFAEIGQTLELAKGDIFQSDIPLKMPPTFKARAATAPPKAEDPAVAILDKAAEAYKNADYRRSVTLYTAALELAPDDPRALNGLAWILATCPDASVRNGRLAVMYAQKACQLTSRENPDTVDTLAAAFAEVGDFPRAIRAQTLALEQYEASEKNDAERRLRSYQNGRPWREDPREAP